MQSMNWLRKWGSAMCWAQPCTENTRLKRKVMRYVHSQLLIVGKFSCMSLIYVEFRGTRCTWQWWTCELRSQCMAWGCSLCLIILPYLLCRVSKIGANIGKKSRLRKSHSTFDLAWHLSAYCNFIFSFVQNQCSTHIGGESGLAWFM